MSRELWAALLYVLLAFGMGAVLGPPRELILVPAIGRLAALLVELPILLGFCWWVAPRVSRRLPPGAPRLRMGLAALAMLLAIELGVGLALRGGSVGDWLMDFATPHGAVTLAAYLVFALIPWWRRGGGHPQPRA